MEIFGVLLLFLDFSAVLSSGGRGLDRFFFRAGFLGLVSCFSGLAILMIANGLSGSSFSVSFSSLRLSFTVVGFSLSPFFGVLLYVVVDVLMSLCFSCGVFFPIQLLIGTYRQPIRSVGAGF